MLEMPEPIAREYLPLMQEVHRLHWNWQLYRTLFGTSEHRYQMLEAVAADSFRKIDMSLLDGIVLALYRLGDTDRRTLSLVRLQAIVSRPEHDERALSAQTQRHLHAFQAKRKELQTIRHERIAHANRAAALRNWQDLYYPSRQVVEESLEHVRAFLNAIEHRFSGRQYGYGILAPSDDGDQLVQVLKWGLRYRELMLSGAIEHSDWCNSGWHSA